ncbi:MAG: AMP-binding protein [Proteobacteria bacterium]|nr:AMP-binding protein [Pseudomonadota bacterium]
MDISKLSAYHARYRPDHAALVCGEHQLTWAQFNARINRTANALVGLGIGKGDKVATLLGNCIELVEIYLAAAKIGAVSVPLSALLRPAGIASLLRDSDTVALLTSANFAEPLARVKQDIPNIPPDRYVVTDWAGHEGTMAGYRSYGELCEQASADEPHQVDIDGDDPYNIIYSSGTTGLPKGIVLSHRVRATYGTLFASAYRMTPESVMLHCGSIVFNGSFLTLMPWLYLGAQYVLMQAYKPASFIDTVAEHKVTHLMMVPSQIIALLNAPSFSAHALASLEMVLSVGAPLHEEHKRLFVDRLPGRFYELYGLTEGFMTHLDKTDVDKKLTSVGKPLQFSDMRIVDDRGNDMPAGQPGEIIGRGPLLMSGYYKRPDLTEKAMVDGWLHSGDIGYVDEDGFLFLVDRQKDMIISGGVNVYPRDIEEVIAHHPAVREVAVFGLPDAKWGETPVAAVVLKSGQNADAGDLRQWINERVEAKFQRISRVLILDDLPRGVTGKVLKRVLREQYGAKAT